MKISEKTWIKKCEKHNETATCCSGLYNNFKAINLESCLHMYNCAYFAAYKASVETHSDTHWEQAVRFPYVRFFRNCKKYNPK
jgi:hypothetical protein